MTDRFTRISDVWSWLPAFRAVAEAESIRGASLRLHVAPSAVSRTLRLLEAHLGCELFERRGRRLHLNAQSERLLAAVRDAMRGVDDGLGDIVAGQLGELGIATSDTLANAIVLPAISRLVRHEPLLRVRLEPAQGDLTSQLVRGEIDLVCTTRPLAHAALRIERLPDLPSSIYCGDSHPLHGRRRVTLNEVQRHGFVAPRPAPDGTPVDSWPASLERDAESAQLQPLLQR
jgi:DNA-binding transcriptional LysR family regulator